MPFAYGPGASAARDLVSRNRSAIWIMGIGGRTGFGGGGGGGGAAGAAGAGGAGGALFMPADRSQTKARVTNAARRRKRALPMSPDLSTRSRNWIARMRARWRKGRLSTFSLSTLYCPRASLKLGSTILLVMAEVLIQAKQGFWSFVSWGDQGCLMVRSDSGCYFL